jgi:superkiller protein 3
VTTWTSLGLLYLYHDDAELANEALYRAQTLDPDYHLAWIGQGLVATKNGHFTDSRVLFEHAASLVADSVSQYDYVILYRHLTFLSQKQTSNTRVESSSTIPMANLAVNLTFSQLSLFLVVTVNCALTMHRLYIYMGSSQNA